MNFIQTEKITLLTPISQMHGIGEKRAGLFEKLGISNLNELIRHLPRGYQHRGNIKRLADAEEGAVGAFMLTIGSEPKTTVLKKRMSVTKFMAFDDTRRCQITYFNQDYIKDVFKKGDTFRFWGKITKKNGIYDLASPQYEPYFENQPLPEFVPLYPLTEGLTQKIVLNTIRSAVKKLIEENELTDILPPDIREKYDLRDIVYAVSAIHSPANFEMLNKARMRLAFDELFVFALGITLTKSKMDNIPALPVRSDLADINEFLLRLEFDLTNAQKRVIDDIYKDMRGAKPMSRLVSGDVGSGKTVCAAAAAFIACKNGYQSAMMAPTEILAQQHYNDLSRLFGGMGVTCALLTGALKRSDKIKVHESIKNHSVDFVIGTHALLSESVSFKKLGLVITDEQHRFGIMQRAALTERGENPHVLVMSATPIPRTLALILYGDLDVSVIDEMPPGRQKVDTFIVDENYRERLNGFIRKQVGEGRQVYIVCPAVEEIAESDEGEVIAFDYGYDANEAARTSSPAAMKSAVGYANELQRDIFPDLNVGFIHGKLKASEKETIMRKFVSNEINILVSTTVIEVGVNVPNATLMIVENAERFGLSQLHQLRGRVGRGKHKSYCILVSDAGTDTAAERLNVMKSTSNGYKIAEKDLALRGPGDFFPTQSGEARQHGGYKFKVASAVDDMGVMTDAAEAAHEIIGKDPKLELPAHKAMLDTVLKIFEINELTMN